MEIASEGRRKRAGFVLGSLALHALLLLLSTSGPDGRSASLADARVRSVPSELELDLDSSELARAPELQTRAPFADARSSQGARPPSGDASRQQREGEGEGAPVPVAGQPVSEAPLAEGDAAEGSPAPGSSGAPRLNLAQLGVAGPNQFLSPNQGAPLGSKRSATAPGQADRATRARDVKARLDHSLSQGLQDRDTALGLGAGSPVMRSLEAAVYASAAPLNGNAVFSFVIDSEGKIVGSSVGAVSSDREKWERVARQAVQSLRETTLRVPKGKSVKLTIALTSHLELPSGADPGLEVRALGIPLKKGAGPRSTRLDLLNPLNPGAPLLLAGDPADIGARARRMVRSHVVSEELL